MFGNHIVLFRMVPQAVAEEEQQLLVYDAKCPIPKSANGTRVVDARYTDENFCNNVRVGESTKVNIMDATVGYLIEDAHDVKVYDVSGAEPRFLFALGQWGLGDGQFNYPNDVAVDRTGRLYIVDRENHRVQVWLY